MSYTSLTGFRASDSIKLKIYIYIRLGSLVSTTLSTNTASCSGIWWYAKNPGNINILWQKGLFVPRDPLIWLVNIFYWRVLVFNTTFNNISILLWQTFLLVEETRVSGETTYLQQYIFIFCWKISIRYNV